MKKLMLSVVLTFIVGIVFVSAKELKPKKSYLRANQEISNLLIPSSAVGELESPVVVKVKIRITANNEIVVLETNSSISELNDYIIENLNYQRLTSSDLEIDKEYVFDVNFKS
ncbi:hypothetical protein SLW70_15030 [Flavobacterium sp. NG2]|uniref:hypothetical protein n=1 Tax=Flavobacterium sp. NG2 TaxID=3097547 RepID=UPI002A809F64|nr:hypothetical protein [Flavobacterium sp. NG2]WPR71236.1 hypothetical protein SLW70_15030 [Flavobacterium sp. NG2]